MPAAARLLAALGLALAGTAPAVRAAEGTTREAPSYSAASVVHAATSVAGPLSPNCIATIYGRNLAWTTRALTQNDIRAQELPTVMPGTGVRVMIADIAAHVYYVSPAQINFLVPASLRPGIVRLYVAVDSLAGPEISVEVVEASPGLFHSEGGAVVGIHASGDVLSADSPARPGEVVVLYAAGLGQTNPLQRNGMLARTPAPIGKLEEFRLLLNGAELPPELIEYAGITPGFAGLYQINLRLPGDVPEDPTLQLRAGSRTSPETVRLPLRN